VIGGPHLNDDNLNLTIVKSFLVDSDPIDSFFFVNFVPFVVKKNFRLS